jgi:hypothetical protein
MSKVKALNRDGKITWCTAKVPGQRNCNHVLHQSARMTDGEFQECVDEYNERMMAKLNSKNEQDRIECAEQGYGLNILKNDVSKKVRDVAKQKLSETQTQNNNIENSTDTHTYNGPTVRLANNINGEEIRKHVDEEAKKFDRELAKLEKEIDNEDKPKPVIDEYDI